jgi:arylsulfatase A-like enzyme
MGRFSSMKVWPVAAALLVIAAAVTGVALKNDAAIATRDGRPNIIIILTDDQRSDTLGPMTTVNEQLLAKGADFEGMIPTSTCCPSRTALLSGLHSHTTGVWNNKPLTGGWPTFHDRGFEDNTSATALHDHGYTTGLFGKYLNYWNRSPNGFVPPGWDRFKALWQETETGPGAGAYYDYQLRGTGPTETYGHDPEDYSTRVIGSEAIEFIKAAEQAGGPYLAYISTTSPHHAMRPDPIDRGAWTPDERSDNAAINEKDLSDKPHYVKMLPKVDRKEIRKDQRRTGVALLSVDRMVGQVLDAADMSNTLVIYMSDNGYMWGEHRHTAKNWPYRWSTDVPMIMRWDGMIEPGQYGIATNVDVTATVLAAARASDAFDTEGQSLLDGKTRHKTVLESNEQKTRPGYCGVRTERYMFVEYQTGFRELYDYQVDPLELDNKAGSPSYQKTEERLRAAAYKLCNPTPPGFYWSD